MALTNFEEYVNNYLTAVVLGSVDDYLKFFAEDIKFCLYPIKESNSFSVTISGVGKESIKQDLFEVWFDAKEESCKQNLLGFSCVNFQTTETDDGIVLLIKWKCWVKNADGAIDSAESEFEDLLLLNENNLIINAEFEGNNDQFLSDLSAL